MKERDPAGWRRLLDDELLKDVILEMERVFIYMFSVICGDKPARNQQAPLPAPKSKLLAHYIIEALTKAYANLRLASELDDIASRLKKENRSPFGGPEPDGKSIIPEAELERVIAEINREDASPIQNAEPAARPAMVAQTLMAAPARAEQPQDVSEVFKGLNCEEKMLEFFRRFTKRGEPIEVRKLYDYFERQFGYSRATAFATRSALSRRGLLKKHRESPSLYYLTDKGRS
jgi:hypothetical protein